MPGWRALHTPPLAGWTRRSPCWQVLMCSTHMENTCRWWITASAAIMNLTLTTLRHRLVLSSSWKPAIGWQLLWSMWVSEQPGGSLHACFSKVIIKNTARLRLWTLVRFLEQPSQLDQPVQWLYRWCFDLSGIMKPLCFYRHWLSSGFSWKTVFPPPQLSSVEAGGSTAFIYANFSVPVMKVNF